MLRAQVGNELSDLVAGEGILEARHLLTAVFDLISDPFRLQGFTNVLQRRPFGRALQVGAMAVGAALVAEERGSCRFGCFGAFGFGHLGGCPGEKEEGYGSGESQTREQ